MWFGVNILNWRKSLPIEIDCSIMHKNRTKLIRNSHYLSVGLLPPFPSVVVFIKSSLTLPLWLSSNSCGGGGGGKGNSSEGLLTLGILCPPPPPPPCCFWSAAEVWVLAGGGSGEVTAFLEPELLGFLFGDPGGDGNLGRDLIDDVVEDERSSWGPWHDTGVVPRDDCADWGLGVLTPPFNILACGELRDGGLNGGTEGVCPLGGVSGGGVLSRDAGACLRWGFLGGLSGGFSCKSPWPFCWWLALKIILDGLLLLLLFLLDHERSCCWEEAFVDDDLRSRLSVRTIGWLYFLRWLCCLLSCCWMLPP